MANDGQNTKKGKASPLALIGAALCLSGSFFMGMDIDGLGLILILAGLPVAIIGIVQSLKKK